MAEEISDRILQQRIRNRILESVELASSFELQLGYERQVPAITAWEVLERWDDWVRVHPRTAPPHAVLSDRERETLVLVADAIEVATEALRPFDYPSMEQAQALPAWAALRDLAGSALEVLTERGFMSENMEDD